MTKPLALAFSLTLATPACGESVDLGGDPAPIVESNEEDVVAILHEQPDFLVSDGDRLYWAGSARDREGAIATIRSCRKVDCARSAIAYAADNIFTWLEVAAGEVYFRTETTVLACPTTGCAGDPRIVVEAADAFTIAGDSLFFSSLGAKPSGIYQKPRWGGNAALVVEVSTSLARIMVRNDQLFWLTNYGVLQRTSLSGERRIETLFDGSPRELGFSLTSDAGAVYWSTYELMSAIERCPLSGCPSEPEVVAAPVRMPSSVVNSDGRLYFNVELESSEAGLVTCLPFECANPRLLGVAMGRGSSTIATDERFVYAFSNQGFQAEVESLPTDVGLPLSSLRRYEK